MKSKSLILACIAGLSMSGCSAEALNAAAAAMASASQPTFNRSSLAGITISQMPFTAPNGVAWDMAGLPDPYVVLVDVAANRVVWQGQTISDVSAQRLPLQWSPNPPVEVFMDRQYLLRAYDDDPVTNDELMFSSQAFTPRQLLQSPAPSGGHSDVRVYTVSDGRQISASVTFGYYN